MSRKSIRLENMMKANRELLGENVIKEGYPSGSTEVIDELRKDIGDDNLLRIYRLGVEAFRAEHRQKHPPLGSTPKDDKGMSDTDRLNWFGGR